jgi:tRNA threonylcarbamoyladenosine biosynthesis protein TsaE
MKLESGSPEWTESLGRALGEVARGGLYVALCGALGGGKTTFVRGLARGLGSNDRVSSPTFVLMREYAGRLPLFHCDLYRLERGRELVELELDDCLRRGVVAAEWADRFQPPAGAAVVRFDFEWLGEESRVITVTRVTESAADVFQKFTIGFSRPSAP